MKKIVITFLSLLYNYLFSAHLGTIIDLKEVKNEFHIYTKDGAVTKIIFYRDDIFRIWVGPNGNFTDPSRENDTPIVIYENKPIKVNFKDEKEFYKFQTSSCLLKVNKKTCMFSLYDNNSNLLFKEEKSIKYASESYQTIQRNKYDYFYGCGMQNGHFCHNDRDITIENIYDDKQNIWNEHGTPNAASFYMTLNGYGVFRNTYEGGKYHFHSTVKTVHKENRFDAYYFIGNLKKILEGYTAITGRPFLTTRWGLEFGDADRYNEGSFECVKFADQYIDKQIPVGWFLPNDGYNMDFSRIPEVSTELSKRGIITGMWTDKKLDFKKYILDHNIRLFKLDIAWVGRGTKFSMNASRKVFNYIENNTDYRGMVWTTLGWSGNHRYSIMWTGDNGYRNPEDWIRWHIPTMIGSGLSAQNAATGDIDGIYGGNADRYVRDLQWKTFTTNMMIIDNWKVAGEEWKKPWSYGEPYTTYNRETLKLKSRLIPYLYTYAHEAYSTGVPVVRACVLEFPNDSKTWGESGIYGHTKHQFMCGEWLMIAPVYATEETNSWSFYLPEGEWTDFFTGKKYVGNRMIDGYDISNYKYPVLVREGAIIPMYPESYYDNNRIQKKPQTPLTLDIYPSFNKNTKFEMFEDDGLTYRFKTDSMYNKTIIKCETDKKNNLITILVEGQKEGLGFDKMVEERSYLLNIHSNEPKSILFNSFELKKMKNNIELKDVLEGWYYNSNTKVIHIKIKKINSNDTFTTSIYL